MFLSRLSAVSLTFIIDKFDLFFTAVIILSVLFGALFATNQSDLKRLIAYSGVIQSGFILSGISFGVYGISASIFYLVTYIIQLIGVFTIFSLISGQLSSNFKISNFKKPFISLINGYTMGGGVGVSMHGSHVVASERLCLQCQKQLLVCFLMLEVDGC